METKICFPALSHEENMSNAKRFALICVKEIIKVERKYANYGEVAFLGDVKKELEK